MCLKRISNDDKSFYIVYELDIKMLMEDEEMSRPMGAVIISPNVANGDHLPLEKCENIRYYINSSNNSQITTGLPYQKILDRSHNMLFLQELRVVEEMHSLRSSENSQIAKVRNESELGESISYDDADSVQSEIPPEKFSELYSHIMKVNYIKFLPKISCHLFLNVMFHRFTITCVRSKKKKKIGQVLKTTYENDLKKLSSFSDLYTLMRSKLPHARLNLPCGKKCLVFIFDPNVIFPVISCSYAL